MKPKAAPKFGTSAESGVEKLDDAFTRIDAIRIDTAKNRVRKRKPRLRLAPADLVERIACLSDEGRERVSQLVDELAWTKAQPRLAPQEAKVAFGRLLQAAEELYCRSGPALPMSKFIRFSRDGECGWCPVTRADRRLAQAAVDYSDPTRWPLE